MLFIQLGCGDVRPGRPWLNVDNLKDWIHNQYGYELILEQIAREENYLHLDMRQHDWPFPDGSADAVVSHHCFEHFDAVDLQEVLRECYRILKPGGVLRCSVPDASYFRKVHAEDNRDNCERLFGEPLRHPDYETFIGWALHLYQDHRAILTEDALWCSIVNREAPRPGISWLPENVVRASYRQTTRPGHYCAQQAAEIDGRPLYSLFMEAFK